MASRPTERGGTKRARGRTSRVPTLSENDPEILGKHGGRGKLGRPSRAEIEREAQRIAAEAAGLAGWRVPLDASPEARQAADWALQRIRDVAEGRVSFRLAASTLKAAITLREEICGAIETKSRISGGMTLEQCVALAAERCAPIEDARRAGASALPPARDPEE